MPATTAPPPFDLRDVLFSHRRDRHGVRHAGVRFDGQPDCVDDVAMGPTTPLRNIDPKSLCEDCCGDDIALITATLRCPPPCAGPATHTALARFDVDDEYRWCPCGPRDDDPEQLIVSRSPHWAVRARASRWSPKVTWWIDAPEQWEPWDRSDPWRHPRRRPEERQLSQIVISSVPAGVADWLEELEALCHLHQIRCPDLVVANVAADEIDSVTYTLMSDGLNLGDAFATAAAVSR